MMLRQAEVFSSARFKVLQAFFICAAGIDSLEGKVGIHIEQDNSRLLGTFPGKPGQEQSVRMSTQAPQHQLAIKVAGHHAEPGGMRGNERVACKVEAADGRFEEILGERREGDSRRAGEFGQPASGGDVCELACLNAFVAQLMHQGIDAGALACAIGSDNDQCLGWVVGRARDG